MAHENDGDDTDSDDDNDNDDDETCNINAQIRAMFSLESLVTLFYHFQY
jgi:hypothetical protein